MSSACRWHVPCSASGAMRLVFVRGTILLREPPAGFDPAGLPGVLWDPRVAAFRAPARHHPTLRALLQSRALPVVDEVPRPAPPGAFAPVTLRPYQEAALCAWELAGRRGLVVLPTGSGKTRVAIAAMARAGCATLC